MINYWKLYEDIRREGKEKKKKLFVNRNVKQCGAQVLVRAGPLESLTLQRRHTTTLGLDWSWKFSLYKQCSFHLVPHFED